jgi:hypothetical protein
MVQLSDRLKYQLRVTYFDRLNDVMSGKVEYYHRQCDFKMYNGEAYNILEKNKKER